MDGSYEGGEVLLYVLGERARVNLMKGTGNRDGVLKKKVLSKEKEISKEEWNSKKWKDGEKGREIQGENKDGAREERGKWKMFWGVILVFFSFSFFRHISLDYCEFSDR